MEHRILAGQCKGFLAADGGVGGGCERCAFFNERNCGGAAARPQAGEMLT